MSVFDSPLNQVFRNPYGSPFNEGAGGGVFELEQFQVTDNGGEPFQVDDEFATPEDFMVRA